MKLNVAIMFGGKSVEHEVSIISAMQAINALDKTKVNVIPIYISKDSQLYSGDSLLNIETYSDLEQAKSQSNSVYLYKDKNNVYMNLIKPKLFKEQKQLIDIVIPIMHGTYGEDGKLQGFLELLDVPFASSDTTASAIGQDKVIMKHIFQNSGLPIVNWFWLYGFEFKNDQTPFLEKAETLGYPVVIKPANLGSSIGISFAKNADEFIEAIHLASEFDEKIVVEKAISNLREVNCSVLGDVYHNEVSLIEEVGSSAELLSFDEKYLSNAKGSKMQGMASTKRDVPAQLSSALEAEVHRLSKAVVHSLNSSGICRIDFMIDAITDAIYINEINTMPGSLAFYLWADKGVDFSQIMGNLIQQAIDRKRRSDQRTTTYASNILSNYAANGSKGKLKM
ncbi:MAG: D-alanine--D-alanine ligase [Erysipelothrix sp.]|nr:D-alanine--D-alanine ligase [Erysipelothrix sp.]